MIALPFNLHVSIIIGFVLSLTIGEAFCKSFCTTDDRFLLNKKTENLIQENGDTDGVNKKKNISLENFDSPNLL